MTDLPLRRSFGRPGYARGRAFTADRGTFWRGWDPLLLASVAGLSVAGALSIYAATRNSLLIAHLDPNYYLKRDLENVAIGVVVILVVRLASVPILRAVALVLHLAACVALLAVLSPLGTTVNGAHAWFSFGSFQLEPSEFVKITSILVGASLLSDRRDNETEPDARSIGLMMLAVGVPLLLILAEPALGIAIVVAACVPVLLALSGVRARWVAALVLGAALGLTGVVQLHLLKPYQEQRFTAFTHPRQDSSGAGYHTIQSEIAVGSGRIFGQGFLQGSQTNGRFIPEQQTDFVFTVTAEEAGLVGSATLLALFSVLFLRGLRIASRVTDPFGRMVAGAIVWWFALQTFVNIGMTVGIMPVTGVPLPFVSYGGSAMFVDCAAVGLLLAVSREARAGPL
ncbi:MAG: rod shape-determining protein RodA [Mycobacteriales bacterium]